MNLYKFKSKRHGTIFVSIIDDKLQFYCPYKREVYGKPFKYTGDNEYVEFRYHPHPDKKMTAKEFSGFVYWIEHTHTHIKHLHLEKSAPTIKFGKMKEEKPKTIKEREEKPKTIKEREEKKSEPLQESQFNLPCERFDEFMMRLLPEDALARSSGKDIQIHEEVYYNMIIISLSLFENIPQQFKKESVVNLKLDGDITKFNPKDFPKVERVYLTIYSNANLIISLGMLERLEKIHTFILEGVGWDRNQINEQTLIHFPVTVSTFGFSGDNTLPQLKYFYKAVKENLFPNNKYTVILRDFFRIHDIAIFFHALKEKPKIIRFCDTLISRVSTFFLKFSNGERLFAENLIMQNPLQKLSLKILKVFHRLVVFEFAGSIYRKKKQRIQIQIHKLLEFPKTITYIHVFGDVIIPFNSDVSYDALRVLRFPNYRWNIINHIDLKMMKLLTVLEIPVGADLSYLPENLRILVLTELTELIDLEKYKNLLIPDNPFKRGFDYGLPAELPQDIEVLSINPKALSKTPSEYLSIFVSRASNLKKLVEYQGPLLTALSRSMQSIYVGEIDHVERKKKWIDAFKKNIGSVEFLQSDFKLNASWEKPWWEQSPCQKE